MKNISALLLGAGASSQLGMPLTWELTRELKDWLTPPMYIELNEHWKSAGLGHREDNVQLVCELLCRQDLHYESIIGAIETEILRSGADVQKYQDLHGIREWLLEIVYYLLYYRQVLNADYVQPRLPLFSGLAQLHEQSSPLWVFSVNHDLILEMLASHMSMKIKSGFKRTSEISYRSGGKMHKLSFELLSRDDISRNNYDFFAPGEHGINLLKLHGSLDLFGQGDELNYLRIKPTSNSIQGIISGLRVLNEVMPYHPSGVNATNHIMYLDEAGQLQFLRRSLLTGVHKFEKGVFSQIAPYEFLPLFQSYLNYAGTLYAIGYSFSDYHLNKAIKDWLSFLRNRRLVVIDPAPKLPNDFGHLSIQVELHRMLMTDFLIGTLQGKDRQELIALNKKYKFYSKLARNKMIKTAFYLMLKKIRALLNKYFNLTP